MCLGNKRWMCTPPTHGLYNRDLTQGQITEAQTLLDDTRQLRGTQGFHWQEFSLRVHPTWKIAHGCSRTVSRKKIYESPRMCMDYQRLNAICMGKVCPLPLMKDMLNHLAKGKSSPNYYRVRIREGDEWRTAFNCLLGCFQFQVLPLGLQGTLPCSCN